MKITKFCVALLATTTPLLSQESELTDLSRYQVVPEGVATPTLMDVEVLEDTYRELVEANDCIAAIPAIVEFSEAANLASNLLRQGLEPFYDASRDARDSITRNRTLLNELVAAERMFNELLKQRNRAWVEEAKCLLEIGDREDAITRLYRALEFIDADSERGLWEEARRLLWAEVGYSPQE